MGDTHTYVVAGQGRRYKVEASEYRTTDGILMLFVEDDEEPVAKFQQHGWDSVHRTDEAVIVLDE